ncbi:MAG: translocation/assembly module TamB domain-containing protein [Bacteroidales bacterium]|nr:translocation/assembly module TamB domain-containing protein [Bacteroidales bacterium]
MTINKSRINIWLRRIVRIFAWIVSSFILLFLILTLLLQFSAVQTWITGKITSSLSRQTQTTIEIERVSIRFPKKLGLKGIYAEDQQGDTLVYAGSIFVDVGMMGLLRNKVNVNKLELENVTANMLRHTPDTVFNFQFIIDAFASEKSGDTLSQTDYIVKNDQGNEWNINIDRVSLRNIRYRLIDHFSGIDLQISLNSFDTRLRWADILNERYHTEDILIDGLGVAMIMSEPSVPRKLEADKAEMAELDIAATKLELSNIGFSFASYDGTVMDVSAAKLDVLPRNIQLHNFLIDLQTFTAEQLIADFVFPATEPAETTFSNDDQTSSEGFSFRFADVMDWKIVLDELSIKQSAFSMTDGSGPGNTSEFDPQNIKLANLEFQARNIIVDPERLKLDLLQLGAVFSDKFLLKNLQANIDLKESSTIKNLRLETGESLLALQLTSPGSFLDISSDALSDYVFELEFEPSHLNSDLAFLVPAMNEFYFNWPGNKGARLGGSVTGALNDLKIDSLWVTGPDFFTTYLDGRIRNITDPENIFLDDVLFRFFAAPQRFLANLPDTLAPEGIELPQYIYADNRSSGSLKDFRTQLSVRTDLGDFAFRGELKDTDEQEAVFDGRFFTKGFDFGKLLKQTETIPQPIALELDFEGHGLELQTMELLANLEINDLMYAGHPYEEIAIQFGLKDSVANISTHYNDEILNFDLDASYGLFSEIPVLKSAVNVEYARLKQLGFLDNDLLVQTNVETDIVFDIEDFFNGWITITGTYVASEGMVYKVPDFRVNSESVRDDYNLNVISSMISAGYTGNISPAGIPDIISGHFTHYYDLPFIEVAEEDTLLYQKFEMYLNIIPGDFISSVLLPGLDSFDTVKVFTGYDSRIRDLMIEISLSGLKYSGIDADDFLLSVISDETSLDFEVQLNSLAINDITLNKFELNGKFENEILDFSLGIKDPENKPFYEFAGTVELADTLYRLQFTREGLLLNGESWNIPNDNLIVMGTEYLQIHKFRLENEGRALIAQSRIHEAGYPIIDVEFREIDIGRLTGFAENQIPPVGGIFNGELSLMNIFENPAFVADLTVSDFTFEGEKIGDIILKAENPVEDRFDLFASLKSEVTSLLVSGNYTVGETPGINMDVDIERLDLPSFEGFTAGNLTHLNGYLAGKMKVTGTTESPVISGELNINETSFRVPALNAGYFLKSEKISFDRQNISLQNIAFEDSTGRRANLNGTINYTDFNKLDLNLDLSSRNFLLMNVKQGQNPIYHGRILMDADLRLRGSQVNPVVEGRLKLNEGSNFTFTLPQAMPEAIGDEGVVEFIQFRDTLFYQLARETAPPDELRSSFEILDVSVNVEIDPKTDVRIIIDEFAGDFLEIIGGGLLSFGIDQGGRISLAGRYEITDGAYLLTFYDVIRRNFRIQSGSNIVWTGDPLDANVNITAIFTQRTSAAELMSNQMAGGQDQSVAMRQQYPFLVYLRMRGNLMEPEISFELDLPPEHRNAMGGSILARITQINQNESELNKQVFALLILGSFIQENPFAALTGGGGISSTARTSASQVLSQQLNRISDRYIRGVDINFEVESFVDITNGEAAGRTELQMEVSRDFFDDRVRITVGGNIELEDETRRREATEIAGDFNIEYLLTPAGNLILRGFRKKNYGDIFDDQVIDTGIALMFSRSYNRFRDFFKKEEETTISEPEDDIQNTEF